MARKKRTGGRADPAPQAGAGSARPPVSASSGALQTEIISPATAIGVKRPANGYGTVGKVVKVLVNMCPVEVSSDILYQYDVSFIGASGRELKDVPSKRQIFAQLFQQHPNTFSRGSVAYDGQKIAYSADRPLDLAGENSKTFDVVFTHDDIDDAIPSVYRISFAVAFDKERGTSKTINLELARRFVDGKQSHDPAVMEALAALNVVLWMWPSERQIFHGRSDKIRSFFTAVGNRRISFGLEVWQGYIQSLRAGQGRLLLNLDIASCVMYRSGPLHESMIEYLENPRIRRLTDLSPNNPNFTEHDRRKLSQFFQNVKVYPTIATSGPRMRKGKPVVIQAITREAASALTFPLNNQLITVANYFRQNNQPLSSPHSICVMTHRTVDGNVQESYTPIERCDIVPGQAYESFIPPDAVAKIVQFSTKKPGERFAAIKKAFSVFGYLESEYVKEFGISIDPNQLPMAINGRVLPAPALKFGQGKTTEVVPVRGEWNMIDKKLFKAIVIKGWVLVVLTSTVSTTTAQQIAKGFITGCNSVGISFTPNTAFNKLSTLIQHLPAGGASAAPVLRAAGAEFNRLVGYFPQLVLAILPPKNNKTLYTEVKHFGMCTAGIATQCLKEDKVTGKASLQYWANVALKVNSKLGGVTVVPKEDGSILSDMAMPTIVFGADVTHPPPRSQVPSYAAVVSSIDSRGARYVASDAVQEAKVELIRDLQNMVKTGIDMFKGYRSQEEKISPSNLDPKRLIFYRDGVSEGEYSQVLNEELTKIKAACSDSNVKPKITLIVVGKRHHIRFKDDNDVNLPAGTVVDRDITSPVEFDWYLQSHNGRLGTSRSAHYVVLHDENQFSADTLQKLTYTLCHTFARATKAVSVPTPVYYAHLVCDKAKLHYNPASSALSDAATNTSDRDRLTNQYLSEYRPVHRGQARVMWWM